METTPQIIGGNRILDKLGQGGMGAVYRAKHETLGREIALKLLPSEFTANPEYVQRFLREARAAAGLRHPNVTQVYDAGEQGGQYYIAMEFVNGGSLAGRLKQLGCIPEAEGLHYMSQAAKGLAAAHAAGLVHRDVKPENLLLSTDGQLKVADFGLVTQLESDSALTRSGSMLGTPMYMSPEQCDGTPADSRSDIYSLGASFFRLLTGSAPFSAPTPMGVLYKHKFEQTPNPQSFNPNLGQFTSNVLLKMMAKRPEDRFQSAHEVVSAIEAIQRGENPAIRHGGFTGFVPPPPAGYSPAGGVPAVSASNPAVHVSNNTPAFHPTLVSAPMPAAGEMPTYTPGQMQAVNAPVINTPLPGQMVHGHTPMPAPMHTPPGGYVQGMQMTPAYPQQQYPHSQPMPAAQPVNFTPPPGQGQTPNFTPPPGQPGLHPGMTGPTPAPTGYAQSAPMPAVQAPPPSSGGKKAVMALAAMFFLGVLLLLAGGGAYAYFIWYPQSQIAEAKKNASEQKGVGQYDAALATLDGAIVKYPKADDLKTLRQGIEAEYVNTRITKLKEQAREAAKLNNFAGASAAYKQAADMLKEKGSLPGVTSDATLASLVSQTSQQADYKKGMEEAQQLERDGRLDDASKAYLAAQKFENPDKGEALLGAAKTNWMARVSEAKKYEAEGKWDAALEKLDRSNDLYAKTGSKPPEDLSAYREKLDRYSKIEKLATGADSLAQSGQLRQASLELQKAVKLDPTYPASEALNTKSIQLTRDADFKELLQQIDNSLKQQKWADARMAYEKALAMDSQSAELAQRKPSIEVGAWCEKGREAMNQQKWDLALANFRKAAELAPNDAALQTNIRDLEKKLSAVKNLSEQARAAEANRDWTTASECWTRLATLDSGDKANYERKAATAIFNKNMEISNTELKLGHFDQAAAAAKAAAPYDPTGGQQANQQLQSIEQMRAGHQKAASSMAAIDTARQQGSQGNWGGAISTLNAGLASDPGNAEMNSMKTAAEVAAVVEKGYVRLEEIRQDGASAVDTALKADNDDKKVKQWLAQIQSYQPKLAGQSGIARGAFANKDYASLNTAQDALRGQSRELSTVFSDVAVNLHGKAATAAKPKANVGGTVNQLLGGRGRTNLGFGVSGDIGDNQKLAAIYSSTAQRLEALSADARNVAGR